MVSPQRAMDLSHKGPGMVAQELKNLIFFLQAMGRCGRLQGRRGRRSSSV